MQPNSRLENIPDKIRAPLAQRPRRRLGLRSTLLLLTYLAVVTGVGLVGGRPLSLHEAVLPQTAREMAANGDWLTPTSGGRPWLESPPLPQWATAIACCMAGDMPPVWLVRLPALLAAVATVLIVARLAAAWYGPTVGLLAGLILATEQEFIRYSWAAEDEIYSCLLITLALAAFAFAQDVTSSTRLLPGGWHPFTRRRWPVVFFFVALGLTNLAKGLFFGAAIVLAVAGCSIVVSRDRDSLQRYGWVWGWLLAIGLGAAWPLALLARHPDAADVWIFDQWGRVGGSFAPINQPWWYYGPQVLAIVAPWSLAAAIGLGRTRKRVGTPAGNRERLLWCWAIVPPLMLSLCHGKHHHYLLGTTGAWAILAALGLRGVWRRVRLLLPSRIARPAPRLAFAVIALVYVAVNVVAGQRFDRYRPDVAFLAEVRKVTAGENRVLIDASMGQLRAFHLLFYLPSTAHTLHNLTFLADRELTGQNVYLITYGSQRELLARYGQPQPVLECRRVWRNGQTDDRITLFRLRLHKDLVGQPADVRIAPLQALRYAPGPFLEVRRW